MNQNNLIGRITKDLQLKSTNPSEKNPEGKSYVRFNLAVKKRNGQDSDFIPIVAWGKVAENLVKYQGKGSLIGVSGRLESGSYINNENKKVYTLEVNAEDIEYLESKNARDTTNQQQQPQQNNINQFTPNQPPQQQWGQPPQQPSWGQPPQPPFGQPPQNWSGNYNGNNSGLPFE